MKKVPVLLFFFISMSMVSPAGLTDFYGCHEMIAAGTKKFEIDSMYLIKTRMLHDLDDNTTIRMSHFIHSDISKLDFVREPDDDDRFIIKINSKDSDNHEVTGWVSDRTRDGVCALEMEAWEEKQYINEFMQILAIYPGGTLALGLPNTQNRVGLIFLVNEGGYNPIKTSHNDLGLFSISSVNGA